ncbi:hypothetical protein [Sphaerisporangium melleum]|uniref:hypothetical protein n=1 Tax=Sphaerisporangium melleum TaxID=321316 RepID=UPI00166DC18A|nr:hypothetical protein [Sphaerisporangium melleum]
MAPARPPQTIEQLWPGAAHEIPRALPDGRKLRPRLFLDDSTLLITVESRSEEAAALYAYHLEKGQATKLADVPTPKDTVLYADGFATGNDRIIWWTARRVNGKEIADIWSVPVNGGKPAVVTSAELPPRSRTGLINNLTVTPDGIAWSAGTTGVYRAPLTGGQAQKIDGTEGKHILTWPWIGTPGPRARDAAPFQSLLNVETGERHDLSGIQNTQVLACGITRCVTRDPQAGTATVLDRGGREQRKLTLPPAGPQVLLRDRFLTADGPGWTALYDTATGAGAELKLGTERGRYLPGADGRLLTFPRDDTFLVIDLTAIT